MKKSILLTITALAFAIAAPAFAQTQADTVSQRDENQQARIEAGLKNGSLNTKEAARLEKGESRVDRMEAHDMKNGSISPEEQARLSKAENAESKRIYAQKHDAQKGNPDSKSSERMQANVKSDYNQEKRINNGLENGSLTDKEASHLEAGQARDDRTQYRAGRNGKVGFKEQTNTRVREHRNSGRIYGQKHDDQQQ